MKKLRLLLALLLLSPTLAHAQVAGLRTLSILDLTTSARSAALGMDFLSVPNAPLSLTLDNPSLIDSRHHSHASLDYVAIFSGAKQGSALCGFSTRQWGTFVGGLQFSSYGRFEGFDETDQHTGSFGASDYQLYLGWAMHIDSNFSLGTSFKPILSQYEAYTAFAFAINIAATFQSNSRALAATLMARNIGTQLATFDGTVEHLPFSLDAALSYKLENAPFRIFAQLADLHRWNLLYHDPLNPDATTDPFTGEVHRQSGFVRVLDNLGRHVNVGIEASIRQAFFLRLGYSWRQTREMQYVDRTSLNFSGFSYGFGLHARRFDLSFARNNYHLGQAPNYLTVDFKF